MEATLGSPMPSRTALCSALLAATTLAPLAGIPSAGADSYVFDEVPKSLLSIGGRGTYFDPNDTSPKWYGGAQVRLHLGQIFAIEGSVDYREKKYDTYRYIWLEKFQSRDENLVDKKYENNAHMVTIGLNFHF
jgi:hypothetical protein